MTEEAFIDSTTLEGQQRIRGYVLRWLERVDYAGKLDRSWPADELGRMLWHRVAREFAPAWRGPLVTNEALAEVVAVTVVEDYFQVFPRPRSARYTVSESLGPTTFRRCVVDFIHDLEEFEPDRLPGGAEAAADLFWGDVRSAPERWGYDPNRGPFVDDPGRAAQIAVEVIRDYYDLRRRAEEARG